MIEHAPRSCGEHCENRCATSKCPMLFSLLCGYIRACLGFYYARVESVGLDWVGLNGIGLDWIGLDWIGLDWMGLDWVKEIKSIAVNEDKQSRES